mmetsp:Transcript_10111/g.28637  ORF Transcript_10111/g.28637 Transcript_10111/m.28637 type:complete len:233 (+) Transcript_10111:164-862(+)
MLVVTLGKTWFGLLLLLFWAGQELDLAAILCDPGVPHQVQGARPLHPVVRQGLEDEVSGKGGDNSLGKGDGPLEDLVLWSFIQVELTAERGATHQKLVEENAHRPNVDAVVIPRLLVLGAREARFREAIVHRARRVVLSFLQQGCSQLLNLLELLDVQLGGTLQELGRHVVHRADPNDGGAHPRVDREAEVAQLDLPAPSLDRISSQVAVIPLGLPGTAKAQSPLQRGGTPS